VKIDSKEVVAWLVILADDDGYKKKKPFPKFSIQEFRFIRDLIFNKPKGLLFYYLADHLMNQTPLCQLPMFNAPSMRKLRFLYGFFDVHSNATQAAIKAGYSPRTAKQQAHRILREIQGYKRKK